MKYRQRSWIHPKVAIRKSKLGGKGLFATEPTTKGKVVFVWGGKVMTKKAIKNGEYKKGTAVEIGEGKYFADPPNESPGKDDYLNHSCEPNLWLKDEVTLIAKRDIAKGEELTADYGTWVSRSYWKMKCDCGSSLCRGIITGDDWKRPDLQKRYKNHFSPYLNKRIEKLKPVSRV